MPYKILEHTADLAVNFRGKDIFQVIKTVIFFFNKEIYLPKDSSVQTKELRLIYENDDLSEIVVDFINDLIYYAEKGCFAKKIDNIEINKNKVIVKIKTEIFKNYELKLDLKAATYHNLEKIKINTNKTINLSITFDL